MMRVVARRSRPRWPPGVWAACAFLVLAVIGPWLAPWSPLAIDLAHEYETPSARHWLGTTDNGVDIMSMLLHGARLAGVVAVSVVLISLVVGAALGTFAGYRGGRVDEAISGACDLMQAFPSLVLNVAVLALVARPGLPHLICALLVNGWVIFARIARAQTLVLRKAEYVQAARALGLSEARILFRHVAPSLGGPLVVQASAALGSTVLAESTLSFLGLGPGTGASFGALLDQGSAVLLRFPHVALIAGATIAFTVYACHRTGDYLRDRLDPRA
jgi:peptide/nickel transport system permease protein